MDQDRADVIEAPHHLDVAVPKADGQHAVTLLLLLLGPLLMLLAILALLHIELLAVPSEGCYLNAGAELHPRDGVTVDIHHH